jgi:hypothetical protein
LLAARVSAADDVGTIVSTFTEQENAGSKTRCTILNTAINDLISQVFALGTAAATGVDWPIGKLINGWITEETRQLWKGPWGAFAQMQLANTPNRYAGTAWSNAESGWDVCDLFGGNFNANNPKHEQQLKASFDELVTGERKGLNDASEKLNRGSFDDSHPEAPSLLAEMMFTSQWADKDAIERVLENPMKLEMYVVLSFNAFLPLIALFLALFRRWLLLSLMRFVFNCCFCRMFSLLGRSFPSSFGSQSVLLPDVTMETILTNTHRQFRTQFSQYLISTAARASGCYMKCNTQPDAQKLCNEHDRDIHLSRFCPAPNKVCQMQCWAQWNHGKDLSLHGLKEYDAPNHPWHINLKTEMANMYQHYKVYGNKATTEALAQTDLDHAPSMMQLPVCDSDAGFISIKNIYHHHNRNMFPSSCGNWRSDKTAEFLEYFGYNVHSPRYNAGNLHHLYHDTIPHSLHDTVPNPFDHFLAFCEVGMRWPRFSHLEVKFCPMLKEETKDMDQVAANVYFCVRDNGPLLYEKPYLDTGHGLLPGSRHKCGKFLKALAKKDKKYVDAWNKFELFHLANILLLGW